MLEQLLRLVANAKEPAPTPELARRLGVSVDLVESMLEQLVSLGYLEAVKPGCGVAACQGCSAAGRCTVQPETRLWLVTERGRQLARAQAPRPCSR